MDLSISTCKKLFNSLCLTLLYNCLTAWLAILLFVITSTAARTAILINFLHHTSGHELVQYYALGLRSDLLVASYLFTPLFLSGLFLYKLDHKVFAQKLYATLSTLILAISGLLFITHYYYFSAFTNHFDQHLFELQGKWLPFWKDYPLVITLAAILLYGFLSFKLMLWFMNKMRLIAIIKKTWIILIILVEFLILYVNSLCGWSSIDPWHHDLSKHNVVNRSSINPAIALFDAFKQSKLD